MENRERRLHRVKDKGGKLAGVEIEYDIPIFDFDNFIKTPISREFVRKAYEAAAQKIAREIEEKANGTVRADLDTYETIAARSLNYTKADIDKWLKSRDWSKISAYKNADSIKSLLEKNLPQIASRHQSLDLKQSRKIAEKIIAELAEKSDPIAEYLFVMLTIDRQPNDDEVLIL